MESFFSPALIAFFQVIAIDLVLSGDNAVIIGLAVAGLPPDLRKGRLFLVSSLQLSCVSSLQH